MATYQCPKCRAEIALADVNVETDVALCRRCGRTTPFSLVSGVAEVSLAQLDAPPPRGVTVSQSMVGGTEVAFHRLGKIAFFLVPFMLVWSGGSLGGIYGSQIHEGKFDVGRSLAGVPFLIGTLVMMSVILFSFFGRWRVRLDGGRGEVFAGVGPVGWTRRFAYGPETVVSLERSTVSRNGVPQKAISVRTGSAQIKFGTTIPEDAKRYLAAAIARECQTG